MKYFNLTSKEIRDFKDKEELEFENNSGNWIENKTVQDKIVLASVNDYRIFSGRDELGFNKKKIAPLLTHFKPVTKEIAKKIGKYYCICGYCSSNLESNKITIIDCREDFSNIKKMQTDVYWESYCCNTTYTIPFPKIKSNREKAEYIKDRLKSNDNLIILFSIKSLNTEVLIKASDFFNLDFSLLVKENSNEENDLLNLDNYLVMKEIFSKNIAMNISENILKRKILDYLLQFRG